jgi:dUTP pyrophosphatase
MSLLIKINQEYSEYLQPKYESVKQYSTDSGFDLYMPDDCIIEPFGTKLVNLGISCEYLKQNVSRGYILACRSSIYKTKIRLANSIGIIDPNYRGNILAAVDNISNQEQILKKGERYFQLIFVQMDNLLNVEFVNNLSNTDRGSNGFGSTS